MIKQQKIVREILDQHTYLSDEGEVLANLPAGSNHKLNIFSQRKTLRQWSFFAHYGFFPTYRLRTASRHKNSVDVSLLYSSEEF